MTSEGSLFSIDKIGAGDSSEHSVRPEPIDEGVLGLSTEFVLTVALALTAVLPVKEDESGVPFANTDEDIFSTEKWRRRFTKGIIKADALCDYAFLCAHLDVTYHSDIFAFGHAVAMVKP